MATPADPTKAQARQKKAALVLSAQLIKSVAAMNDFIKSCAEAGDPKVLNADDGRQRLRESMDEYGHWLKRAYPA